MSVLKSRLFCGFCFSGMLLLTNPSVSLGADNRANRSNKHAYAAWEAIGMTMTPVSGVRAGYFVNTDAAAEVSYGSSTTTIGDFESKKSIIEAKAKYFFGDTFYTDGGLTYENFDVKYTVNRSGQSFERERLNGNISNVGLNAHIGNQWQWPGFTLGCDWIGYFASLSSKSKFSSVGNLDAADQTKQENGIKTAMGGSSLHLGRLYLGWAF
jgi:hypothetical protein